jgi:hypothetical protein
MENLVNELLAVADETHCGSASIALNKAAEALAPGGTPGILMKMAETYQEHNRVYGDNYMRVGKVMSILFPDGVELVTPEDFNRWHLFELVVIKLTRFTQTGLTHIDTIHDLAVYAAMVEMTLQQSREPIGPNGDSMRLDAIAEGCSIKCHIDIATNSEEWVCINSSAGSHTKGATIREAIDKMIGGKHE